MLWRLAHPAGAHLAVVLLAVDGAAGLAVIPAAVLVLVARHYAVGAGGHTVLAVVGLAGAQAGGFRSG